YGIRHHSIDPGCAMAGARAVRTANHRRVNRRPADRVPAGRHATAGADLQLHGEIRSDRDCAVRHHIDDRRHAVSFFGSDLYRIPGHGAPLMPFELFGNNVLGIALTLPRIVAAFLALPLLSSSSMPPLVRN